MGFRDYAPGLNTFTTRDMYNGALADMGLGMDPYTGSRYAFTAGNPISGIELDGHMHADPGGGGGGSVSSSWDWGDFGEEMESQWDQFVDDSKATWDAMNDGGDYVEQTNQICNDVSTFLPSSECLQRYETMLNTGLGILEGMTNGLEDGAQTFEANSEAQNYEAIAAGAIFFLADALAGKGAGKGVTSGGVPRTPDGKYAPRNGEKGRDGAQDEQTAWDQLEVDGALVDRVETPVSVPGMGLRKYDGTVQIDGKWYGIEVKGGGAKRTVHQKTFDSWLNTPGNTVQTGDGRTLVGVFDVWIDR